MNQDKNYEVLEFKYNLLVDAVLDGATLDYNGKNLRFEGSLLNSILKLIEKDKYHDELNELKIQKETIDNRKAKETPIPVPAVEPLETDETLGF